MGPAETVPAAASANVKHTIALFITNLL